MSNRDFKEEAEAHWTYTAGVIELCFRFFMKLGRFLYTKAMVHGYKHGYEDAKNEG